LKKNNNFYIYTNINNFLMKENDIKEDENKEVENKEKNMELLSAILTKTDRRPSLNTLYESVNSLNSEMSSEEDTEKMISDLQQKVILLEKNNKDLHSKIEELTKKNMDSNSLMMRLSLVGMRKRFGFKDSLTKAQDDSVKLAEIIKEKDDLQAMNEKMLDLLTDKELENEDLLEKLENNRLEAKLEHEKSLEKIQALEDKIGMLENSKSGGYDIDDVVNEYNTYKERLKKQVNEYSKNEENLKQEIDLKERTIQRLKEEIQGLESENLQLASQSEKKDELNEKDIVEIEQLKHENDKIKRELTFLDEKLKLSEENTKKLNQTHENQINDFQKQIENEQNYLKIYKENKSKEIDLLKTELSKNSREINMCNKKIELTEKILNAQKEKNFMIQNKLDKKSKELQDMNEYTKKLLTNKDNLLTQYEKKIEEITKDKFNLISQNKELLDKIKSKSEEINYGTNLADILNEDEESKENKEDAKFYIQENKLLNEEMKDLKEQLATQAKELVELNSLDKEVVRLKAQNESLTNENKNIKSQLEEAKKKELIEETNKLKSQFSSVILRFKKKPKGKLENKLEKLVYEKQLNALKKLKEDEKKDYETQIKKLQMELVMLKLKNKGQQTKNDVIIDGYKGLVKGLSSDFVKKYLIYIEGFIILILILIIKIMKK